VDLGLDLALELALELPLEELPLEELALERPGRLASLNSHLKKSSLE